MSGLIRPPRVPEEQYDYEIKKQVKLCTICNKYVPFSDFGKAVERRHGLRGECKPCRKDGYKNDPNRVRYTELDKARRENNILCARIYVKEYLQSHPCVDCEEEDWIVLEFDHVRDEKFIAISRMVAQAYRLDLIIEEIEKCEVRCANCHRRKTYERGNYWRVKELTA